MEMMSTESATSRTTSAPSAASVDASSEIQASAFSPTQTGQAPECVTTQTVYQVPRRVVRLSIPDGWLRALLAGVQAAFMGWGLSTLLVVSAYALVHSNPWMSSTTWTDAMGAGATLWASALGASVQVPGENGEILFTLTARPLLLSILAIVSVRGFLRSSRRFPRSSYLFAIPGFMLTSAFFIGANQAWVLMQPAMQGAFLIATLGVWWAWAVERRRADIAPWWHAHLPAYQDSITRGLRAGRLALWALLAATSLFAAAVLIAKWAEVSAIAGLLNPGGSGDTAILWVAQLLYVPHLLLWMLAWATGSGILLGADAAHSIGASVVAPIPPIPFLGVLPGSAPGYGWIAVPVCVSLIAGVLWARRAEPRPLRKDLVMLATMSVVVLAVIATLLSLSVSALGPGRLAMMGPYPLHATALLFVETILPVILGYIAAHAGFIKRVKAGQQRYFGQNLSAAGSLEKVPASPLDASESVDSSDDPLCPDGEVEEGEGGLSRDAEEQVAAPSHEAEVFPGQVANADKAVLGEAEGAPAATAPSETSKIAAGTLAAENPVGAEDALSLDRDELQGSGMLAAAETSQFRETQPNLGAEGTLGVEGSLGAEVTLGAKGGAESLEDDEHHQATPSLVDDGAHAQTPTHMKELADD